MFLNYIKRFLLKKTLKKQLRNVKVESLDCPIVKVGLIVDERFFSETASLKKEICTYGILESNIRVLAYREVLRKNEVYIEKTFSLEDISIQGEFNDKIKVFLSEDFDLLVNYYDEEKSVLQLVTHQAKAKFKVGFSTVDKRLNHLMITISIDNFKDFTKEMFRYLKILNKL